MALHAQPAIAVSRRARERRRMRLAALAAWAPWGPLAPPTHGRRLTLRYLVRHSLDMEVMRAGRVLGRVERVVTGPFDFWPAELLVRTPAGDVLRVRAADVVAAEPRRGRLILAP